MKKRSRTQNSIINIFTGIGGQLLSILLKFISRTVFIHTLGPSYLGINGLFADILSMLSLAELGIDTAMSFKLYKPLADQDEKRVRVLLKFYKIAYLIVGTTVLIAGLAIIPLLRFLIKEYDKLAALGINAVAIFLLYLLQSVSSYMFFASRSAIIKADQKEYILNIVGYANAIATSVVQIIGLLIFKSYFFYIGVLIGFSIFQNMINALIAKHYYPYAFEKEKESISREEVKNFFKDLGALFVYKVNIVVIKATDNIVLSSFIGLDIVGLYSNYLLFYTTIKQFLNKIYEAVKASMGNLFAVESDEKKYEFFEILCFLAILLYGTAGIGVAVEANEFIDCWIGHKYTIPFPFPILMGIEILFVGIKNTLGQIRNVSGAFRQMWYRPIIGVLINLTVSIALVKICGIYGVIIGTITADFCANYMVDPHIIYRVSFHGIKPVQEYYKKNGVYFMILFFTGIIDTLICKHFFIGYGWGSVFIHILICGISVPAVMLLVFWNCRECQYIVGIGNHIIKKILHRG